MSDKLKVMRTGGGSPANWSLHSLKKIPNVTVVAVDANPLSVSFLNVADEFDVVPRANDPRFVKAMLDCCSHRKIDILIPAVDEELIPLAQSRSEFERIGTKLVLSDADCLETCLDKWRFYEHLLKNDFPAPRTYLSGEGLHSYPYILKPRRGRGSAGVYPLKSVDDKNFYCGKNDDFIIQDFVPGVEYTMDTLSDPTGRMIYGCPRERVATDSGISTIGKTVKDDEALDIVARLLESIRLQGPANVQYIRPDSNHLYMIEINPRLSGGGALTEAAGIPYLEDVVRVAQGLSVPARDSIVGVMMFREWTERFVDGGTLAKFGLI